MTICHSKLRDAYFAGLIDGEGSLGLRSHGPCHDFRKVPTIEVKMGSKETILELQRCYGGQFFYAKCNNPKWSDMYRWRVTEAKARDVLVRILPHLITKKEDAQTLIEHWASAGLWPSKELIIRNRDEHC